MYKIVHFYITFFVHSYIIINTYKSVLKGKYFYQVNRFYPSSQICNKCGFCDDEYRNLNKREYVCKKCGETIDRDLNASINIMFEGLKMFLKTI